MKNKKVILFVLAIIVMVISICVYQFVHNIELFKNNRAIEKNLLKNEELSKKNNTIKLNDIIDFDYDMIYSFNPYETKESMQDTIGFKTNLLRETVSEGMQNIAFVKDNKIVCYIHGYGDNNGYYLDLDAGKYKKSEIDNIIFKVTLSRDSSKKSYLIYTYSTSFFATVIESSQNNIIVKPEDEESILKSSDKIIVNTESEWENGLKVIVHYDGIVMETYPARVISDSVQIYTTTKMKELKKEYTDINLLPDTYSIQNAIKDNCYVYTHVQKHNKEVVDKFIKNVKESKDSYLRVAFPTIEGDTIINDVMYQNGEFIICIDNTRDEFSNKEDRIYYYKKYNNMMVENNMLYIFDGENFNDEIKLNGNYFSSEF